MDLFKIKEVSIGRGVGFKSIRFLITNSLSISIIFILKITNLTNGTRKLAIKLYSNRLNLGP